MTVTTMSEDEIATHEILLKQTTFQTFQEVVTMEEHLKGMPCGKSL